MSTDFAFPPYNPNTRWADEDETETQKQHESMSSQELEFYNKNSDTYTSKMEVVVNKKKQRQEKKKVRSPKKNWRIFVRISVQTKIEKNYCLLMERLSASVSFLTLNQL